MTAVDVAERKSMLRAIFFYCLAGALLLLLIVTFSGGADRLNGLWVGIMLGAALNLMPLARWLKPDNPVARLLEDESTHDHRRTATTAGFWAGFVASLAMTIIARYVGAITADDAVRVVGTAAMTAALISFATLELRATR